jgi:hypothetical protein
MACRPKLAFLGCIGSALNFRLPQASEYLKDKSYTKLVDASLKEHNSNELEAVCEVIKECIDPDPTRRPTMRDVVGKLRPALNISPEAAAPRLSPLCWAELELLSVKAS